MNISNIHDRMRLRRPFIVQISLYNMAVAFQIYCSNYFFQYLMNNKDIHLDLLRKLEANPKYTQRELSREMEVSLGKVNYCMKKLIEKGWVKLMNFTKNPNKDGYAYLLTPKGIEEKTRLTFVFLKIKVEEYEILKEEISILKQDTKQLKSSKR